ncbi:sugar phosphate isomerase/epimerase [Candidatus Pacearchaeota archaeon]|nr:sugar phosphate isomerase/epimerase [Candidatus Pacearchaeota archaeon]
MVSYESIYPGIEYTSVMPSNYVSPMSYQIPISEIGMAIDPRTANQLGEVNAKINPGVRTVEVQGTFANVFESVPEQHLDEIRRLMKLTGVKPTMHGPMLDASGVGEQGYTEENRFGVEKQMESAVIRAKKLDPEGNIPVTFHSTAQLQDFNPKIVVGRKDGKPIFEEQGVFIVNEDTGQMQLIKPEKRYLTETEKFSGKAVKFDSQKEIDRINQEQWTQNLSNLNYYTNLGENVLKGIQEELPEDLYKQVGKVDLETIKNEEDRKQLEQIQRALVHGHNYLRDSYRMMKRLFDTAWSNIKNEEDRKKLEEYAKWAAPKIEKRDIDVFNIDRVDELRHVVDKGFRALSSLNETPAIFKPLVDKGRELFAEKLSKQGVSKSEAKKIAEKMIGVTWDVGHINMLRKKGYSEKDIIEQTKLIAPYVKHAHLSDNFGLDHTELPMGMGNVPFKPMMEELKKAGFKGEHIIEAGNWWQYLAQQGGGTPFWPSIEAFNSPVYAMAYGPTWGQAGKYGMYYSGYGPVNPPMHHQLYGASFVNLPVELGGEIPGDKGRFAGTPNQ